MDLLLVWISSTDKKRERECVCVCVFPFQANFMHIFSWFITIYTSNINGHRIVCFSLFIANDHFRLAWLLFFVHCMPPHTLCIYINSFVNDMLAHSFHMQQCLQSDFLRVTFFSFLSLSRVDWTYYRIFFYLEITISSIHCVLYCCWAQYI